jgi:DNA-binding NarL/FixJ family response regulator
LRLTASAGDLGLSPKQRQVALLLAQGLSNVAIARELHVTPNTASYHVKQVFARLNVHDRAAVGRALQAAALR